ncbi:hypothetical protein HPB51_028559 [Rhipicephalus microplus]|uniref:Uncharacterized protein n=1 Tax=Rhipicephalus microplus TaxID=6941 RepID=A0A9J6CXG8_RHIMP|nr:hypothetical protein HPB51_028559 [Rhipicephalus microplus]
MFIEVPEWSSGPVITFLFLLARSTEPRRSFGTKGTIVSIAFSEALDANTCELVVRISGLAWQKVSSELEFFHSVFQAEGTIKYGINKASTARATVGVTYRDKEPLDNLLWEVGDGQEAGDNEWVATLVRIGQRLALPHVGDSEDIFNNKVNKDFEPEANAVEEEPRLASRVPSDEAANQHDEESVEDDEPYRPSVPSSSISTSTTGNPPNLLPDVESPVGFEHIPGYRKRANRVTFGDFEPEANAVEEEPRLQSRVPSDEAANQDNEESVEEDEPYGKSVSGSSTSTSTTGNPPNLLPDVESPVGFEHIPGNRKGGCGDMPEVSFFCRM